MLECLKINSGTRKGAREKGNGLNEGEARKPSFVV